jgi:hypothetical protein
VASGIPTAVSLVGVDMPADEPEQLDLLGLPERGSSPAPRRGPGRPAGARNRRTQEWVEYLQSRYASPLEVLAQIATAPIAELAKALGCKPLEALQEKRQAAIALAPFLHQRQAIAVDVTNRREVRLIIETGGELELADDRAEFVEIVQNQGDTDAEPGEV